MAVTMDGGRVVLAILLLSLLIAAIFVAIGAWLIHAHGLTTT